MVNFNQRGGLTCTTDPLKAGKAPLQPLGDPLKDAFRACFKTARVYNALFVFKKIEKRHASRVSPLLLTNWTLMNKQPRRLTTSLLSLWRGSMRWSPFSIAAAGAFPAQAIATGLASRSVGPSATTGASFTPIGAFSSTLLVGSRRWRRWSVLSGRTRLGRGASVRKLSS